MALRLTFTFGVDIVLATFDGCGLNSTGWGAGRKRCAFADNQRRTQEHFSIGPPTFFNLFEHQLDHHPAKLLFIHMQSRQGRNSKAGQSLKPENIRSNNQNSPGSLARRMEILAHRLELENFQPVGSTHAQIEAHKRGEGNGFGDSENSDSCKLELLLAISWPDLLWHTKKFFRLGAGQKSKLGHEERNQRCLERNFAQGRLPSPGISVGFSRDLSDGVFECCLEDGGSVGGHESAWFIAVRPQPSTRPRQVCVADRFPALAALFSVAATVRLRSSGLSQARSTRRIRGGERRPLRKRYSGHPLDGQNYLRTRYASPAALP